MAAPIPRCRNAVDGTCRNSDVRLVNENDEAWIFRCENCRCIQAVSKDSIRDKSNFDNAAKRRQQAIEMQQKWERRKKTFI